MACEENGCLRVEKFVVLLASHRAIRDGETENQLNPTDLHAKPPTGNFASVVKYFKMEFFLYKVADLKIYCECTDTALWSVLVTLCA